VLGIREVNLGQYLNGGDPVVPLQALDKVHVNFTVPQQQIGQLAVGVPVEVQVEGPDSLTVTGRITAINSIIDEATRNIEVQATFDNRGGILRPGMFVETSILLGDRSSFIALPASAISYAPYGNSVFIVENMNGPDGKSYLGVKQQFVTLGESRGDLVAVLTGLEPGTQVVTSGVFKLRTGAAVEVNNQVRPADSASPKPEDS
jgi:membrane fusion protein (multidrug efflux system)